ncbi:MAG: S8/S53 family peptidase [Candidatus Marinimicrobia bacterium]|nr:S8/S53 family peptidase [Candidatus Neomarinimicrobiota bacterium]
MQRTSKIISILLLSATLLLAVTPVYYADRFLFSLDENEEVLTAEQCKNLNTPYPELNKLIKKFNIIKIEPWLPHAKATDHDGDVYLNRIYRLITQQDIEAPLAMIEELKNVSTAIQSAEREAIMRTHAIPDDPMIGNQWYLVKAQVKEAWDLWDLEGGEIPGDHHIVIAIVDDGVEYTHPDLWKNIWINQDEIPAVYFGLIDVSPADSFITAEEAVAFTGDINNNGTADLRDVISSNSLFINGVDDDTDGYIDNIIGWDTDGATSADDDDKDPMVTNNSHGTHVAGLAGATTNNGVGIASAGYNISIMPVKATGNTTERSINTGWQGLVYAAHAGADIINCSWGGPGESTYSQNLINTAYNQYGAIIVAAAGNGDDEDGQDAPHYPSGYKNVVSVTAVSSSDIFSWASYGAADPRENFDGVDISAPGENMYSTYLTKESTYAYLRGTSMASPFVASCLGLLKSVYPDSTNDWLVDRILENTDPIDDINPDYAGQIGTGRVNIFKALMFDKLPKLSFTDKIVNITDGDVDSVLNPGEEITLFIELKNDTGWTAASNVQGILRTGVEGITITDSIGIWPLISQNTTAINDGDGYSIQFSDNLLPADYEFELELESATDEGYPYNFKIHFDISLSLDQEGFPFYTSTEVETSPLFVDINDDGMQEIIFGDKSGELYVIDHKGDTLAGFPKSLGSQIGGVAIADIDLDDTLEIVATAFDKLIQVYDVYGNHEWTRHADFFITAIPAIGNIDIDPELEVVVGSYDQKIYAINHDSTDVATFPYATEQLLHGGVSLADMNADGQDEIIYISKNGQCGILNSDGSMMSGWPVSTSGSVTSEPQVIVTGDQTAIILMGNDMGDMYGFDLDGTQRFMVDGNGSIKASPAIYSYDDNIYAFFATTQGSIYKVDIINNTLESGWPKEVSPINQSLIIADVLDNETDDAQVLAMGNNGFIYALDMSGSPVEGFPINTRFLSKSALAITDIDDDGDNDIIAGNYSGISVIDLKNFSGEVYWPMHRGSADRKGSVSIILTGIEDLDIPEEFQFELIGNAPNPFNPRTTIYYKINNSSPVDLRIYSLDGKLVMTKNISYSEIGMNNIKINMENFSSGIYLYSLESGNETRKAKMIYLK